MEDMRLLLKKAVEEGISEEHRDQANRLVDAVCDAFDAGANAGAIRDAVATEVNILLEDAESILSNAEKIMRVGA